MNIFDTDIKTLSEKVKSGEITSVSLVEKVFENIDKYDAKIGAYLFADKAKALKSAEIIDDKVKKGEKLGALAGVPIGIKDNICTTDMPTTCASKMLEGFMSPYDASVIKKLRAEDAVFTGKLNLDEFAMGIDTTTSYFHPTHNPYDLDKTAGGSSGGSAAAVASDMALAALGTDTGGSIRQPAGYCGICSIKPTYGVISRYGIVAYASSLDQVGPMGKSVEDIAYLLDLLAFRDEMDSTSLDAEEKHCVASLKNDISGKKIALVRTFLEGKIAPDVKKNIEKAAKNFENIGVKVDYIDIDVLEYALPAYYIISCAEASSNLARYDGIEYGYRAKDAKDLEDLFKNSRREGFGTEVKRRILLGTYVLSSGYYDAYYNKALKVRRIVKDAFVKAFESYDALLSPVSPTTATKLYRKNTDPVENYKSDLYTVPVNVAGLPSLVMPCGTDADGMPVGMQLIGNYLNEELLTNLAYNYQEKYRHEFPKKAVI